MKQWISLKMPCPRLEGVRERGRWKEMKRGDGEERTNKVQYKRREVDNLHNYYILL